jgi:signal transduction histidine kinase
MTSASPMRASLAQWGSDAPAAARSVWPYLEQQLGHYLLLMGIIAPGLALLVWLLHHLVTQAAGRQCGRDLPRPCRWPYLKGYAALLLLSGLVVWWLVLTHKAARWPRRSPTARPSLLMREIESHRRTDEQLQRAKQAAELANQAKSRYITGHQPRAAHTPQQHSRLCPDSRRGRDHSAATRRQAIRVIRRSGDHLLSVIEGTLDIARIEAGKLTWTSSLDFREFIQQIVGMFELQARNKGLNFAIRAEG